MSRVVGILLAAGQSRRFGSNKCLALLPDQTAMGLHAARNLQSHVDDMVVVTSPADAAIETMFLEHGFVTHTCTKAALGMSESLKSGVVHFDDQDVDAYLIALADMPLIKTTTYQALVNELRNNRGIVLPQYAGKRGHPVGFNHRFKAELLSLQGDQGAKGVLQKYPEAVRVFDVDDPGIHQDFDTLERFEQFFNQPSS